MKILFAVRSLSHYPYISSIVESLSDCEIELFFDKKWSTQPYNNKFKYGWLKNRTKRRWVFILRELRSYISYTRRKGQSEYYLKRQNGYLPSWLNWLTILRPIRFLLAKSPLFEWLAMIEWLVPPCREITAELKSKKPDIVFVTPMNMRFSEETEYAKAAKALGIPVATAVLSWDNLTTKGVYAIQPDLMFVWNESQKKDAIEIHGVSESAIRVVGAPFFDKWFNAEHLLEERDKFCERFGIDPEKPYFVYLGSSGKIAPDESWLVEKIGGQTDMQMIVRTHPTSVEPFKKIWHKFKIWPGRIPDDEFSKRQFYNLLKHSEFVVGINTSAMIDAVILNKPCVALITGKHSNTQGRTSHFRELIETHALHFCFPEWVDKIPTSCDKEPERRWFAKNFIRPLGTSAGENIANILKETEHIVYHKGDDTVRTEALSKAIWNDH